MTPWAVYSRVSRVGDREDTLISPDLQAARAVEYAAARGLEVEVLPAELDVSGGATERPILGEAIEGVESGRFAGIIVAQLDRLSRMNLVDALRTIERIEAAGGQVIAVAENFDAATPEGRLGRNVMLSMAQMQLDRSKLQFRASKQQAVERGIWPISRVPYGYRKGKDRRLKPDKRQAKRVVRAYEARAAGASWNEIGQMLGMGATSTTKIVRNPVYLGEIVYGEWRNPAAHPAIVSRDLWEACQAKQPRPARRPDSEPALLAGLARCPGCGGALTPNASMNKGYWARIYRCPSASKANGRCRQPSIISQRKLDRYVEQLALAEIDQIAVSAAERTRAVDRASDTLQAAEAELAAYQRAVRVAQVGEEAFAAGMRSRVEDVDRARRKLAEARLAVGPVPTPGVLGEVWEDMSIHERRHVLRGALSAVWVRKGAGPCEDRVKVIAAGYTARVSRRVPVRPIEWVDLPGEIRPAAA